MNTKDLTLTPAYGRDYKSKAEVDVAWHTGKDFCIATPGYPTYINKPDAIRAGITSVAIRYKKLTAVHLIQVKEG